MNRSAFFKYCKHSNRGFTLIEVLTVFFITTFISLNLLTNVLRAKPSLIEAAQVLISDIRISQANALASKQFRDPATGVYSYRCGYGFIHPNTTNKSYFLYAGRLNTSGNCSGSKIFVNDETTPTVFTRMLDSRLELVLGGQLRDVYFQSPDGRVFINNNSCPASGGSGSSQIVIRRNGVDCPSSDCIYVCVYASGKIETRTSVCPDISC